MHRLGSLTCVIAICTLSLGADWSQFRGPHSNSLSIASKLPLNWNDDQNTAWKVELEGRGASSPIVVRDRVIVTCSAGHKQDHLIVLAFDTNTGTRLWRREFWATGRTATHPTSCVAAPTPASDGERIFAFYSSNDLICLDLDGNLLWLRGLAYDFPKTGNDVGMASSPVVVDQTLIVQVENQGDSFAAGIDVDSGQTRWRIERDRRANWASPVEIPATDGGKPLLLLQSPNTGLSAHDPRTGEMMWNYELVCGGIPSPLVAGQSILVSSNGLTKLTLNEPSLVPEHGWASNRLRPGNASPVAMGDLVLTVNGGVLNCGLVETGETKWQLRVEGNYWATPIVAGDLVYLIGEDGVAKVVRVSPEKGEVVGEGKFEGPIQGSPAVADDALYVRSDKYLWKISGP